MNSDGRISVGASHGVHSEHFNKRELEMKKRERRMIDMTVADAISSAHSDLMSLGEELRTWAENIEEKFSSTDKYSRIDEAASTLESINEPDVPENLGNIAIQVQEQSHRRKDQTRPRRRDHAVYMIEVAMQAVQEKLDEQQDKENVSEQAQAFIDEAETLVNDLETFKDEADQVEFPGMYG